LALKVENQIKPENFDVGGEYGGIKEGKNDQKVPGWRGLKLPTSGHRYCFQLYALDEMTNLGHKDSR
ncbi:hypothetical protein ACLOJK_007155, partial [Asimina triloba]